MADELPALVARLRAAVASYEPDAAPRASTGDVDALLRGGQPERAAVAALRLRAAGRATPAGEEAVRAALEKRLSALAHGAPERSMTAADMGEMSSPRLSAGQHSALRALLALGPPERAWAAFKKLRWAKLAAAAALSRGRGAEPARLLSSLILDALADDAPLLAASHPVGAEFVGFGSGGADALALALELYGADAPPVREMVAEVAGRLQGSALCGSEGGAVASSASSADEELRVGAACLTHSPRSASRWEACTVAVVGAEGLLVQLQSAPEGVLAERARHEVVTRGACGRLPLALGRAVLLPSDRQQWELGFVVDVDSEAGEVRVDGCGPGGTSTWLPAAAAAASEDALTLPDQHASPVQADWAWLCALVRECEALRRAIEAAVRDARAGMAASVAALSPSPPPYPSPSSDRDGFWRQHEPWARFVAPAALCALAVSVDAVVQARRPLPRRVESCCAQVAATLGELAECCAGPVQGAGRARVLTVGAAQVARVAAWAAAAEEGDALAALGGVGLLQRAWHGLSAALGGGAAAASAAAAVAAHQRALTSRVLDAALGRSRLFALADVAAQQWQSHRPFRRAGRERATHGVRLWAYVVRGVLHDLREAPGVPEALARDAVAALCSRSVRALSAVLLAVTPSRARAAQYRLDLLAVCVTLYAVVGALRGSSGASLSVRLQDLEATRRAAAVLLTAAAIVAGPREPVLDFLASGAAGGEDAAVDACEALVAQQLELRPLCAHVRPFSPLRELSLVGGGGEGAFGAAALLRLSLRGALEPCLLPRAQVEALVRRRHELGEWEYPAMTEEERSGGEALRSLLGSSA